MDPSHRASGVAAGAAASATIAAEPRPYAPSHVDWVVERVARSPIPAPVAYAILALTFVAIEISVKLADGTFPQGYRLIHVLLPVYAMAAFAAAHGFGTIAADALSSARPLLTLSDSEVAAYRYRLTTLPARHAILAALTGLLALAFLTAIQPADTFAALGTMTSQLTSAVEWTWQVLLWSGVGATAYLIVRQMGLVWELTTRHTRIDLFALGPIYAYSRLTAIHAVFTAAVVVAGSLALSRLAGTLQWTLFAGAALVLAGAAFVVPLWGAYRLIRREKRRRENRLGRAVERLVALVEERAESAEISRIDELKSSLEGVVLARDQVRAISAWPWRPETLGGVISALVAPLAIWLITRLLEALVR